MGGVYLMFVERNRLFWGIDFFIEYYSLFLYVKNFICKKLYIKVFDRSDDFIYERA